MCYNDMEQKNYFSPPDKEKGLTTDQVNLRIKEGLNNVWEDKTSKSVVGIIRDNILTFFNLINAILAVLIIFVGSYKNLLFLGIVIGNTFIGIAQELRAKCMLDKLKLITATKVSLIRNGEETKVDICDIVLDDIMLLSTGNQICADAVVTKGMLEVNESLITGESKVILKRPGDHLFSGSFVVSGKAQTQVKHVGKDNFANKLIAEAKVMKKSKSELRRSINIILKIVSFLIVPLGIGLFLSQYHASGETFNDSVVNTVAAVLGMIPEGLVLLTSVSLAVGVINLGRKKTLVHELFCIETLARVDILCLDKTGTLTEGRMKVENSISLQDVPVDEIMGNLLHNLKEDNATSLALQEYFKEKDDYQLVCTIPFSSERKYSGVSFKEKGTYLVGAFEFLFQKDAYPEYREQLKGYTLDGIRVITLAYSRHIMEENHLLPEELVPYAFILISDVVRESAKDTLKYFMNQGVELMVISGDNPATVSNIAKKTGLPHADSYIDASTLTNPNELLSAVKNFRIFGRVSPTQKKDIVKALQAQGHIVAMTGDGVNDVLALKEADCSIAMAAGSDSAKNCSNLVLLDSDFSSMPYIVHEGRRVINNIQSAASLFLVKTLFSLVLSLLTLIIASPYPFIPIQLSAINVFAVGIPNLILSLEPNPSRVTGSFIKNVLHNALTGATMVVLEVAAITVFCDIFNKSDDLRSTLCVLATGITSLSMIRKVYPLNTWLRKTVYYSMFTCFVLSCFLLPKFFNLIIVDYKIGIFVICAILITPFILYHIDRILYSLKNYYLAVKEKSRRKLMRKKQG